MSFSASRQDLAPSNLGTDFPIVNAVRHISTRLVSFNASSASGTHPSSAFHASRQIAYWSSVFVSMMNSSTSTNSPPVASNVAQNASDYSYHPSVIQPSSYSPCVCPALQPLSVQSSHPPSAQLTSQQPSVQPALQPLSVQSSHPPSAQLTSQQPSVQPGLQPLSVQSFHPPSPQLTSQQPSVQPALPPLSVQSSHNG